MRTYCIAEGTLFNVVASNILIKNAYTLTRFPVSL